MYTLYYYPLNASLAPHFVLEHIGCNFNLELVDRQDNGQKKEDYLQLNPAGRIPTLVDDNLPIFESAAICLHLAEKHPEKELFPPLNSIDRPLAYQWLMYLTNTLQAELMIYFYPKRHGINSENKVNVAAAQEVRISDILTILDNELQGQDFLIGKKITICDYYLFMLAIWADEIPKPPLSFNNLSRYLKSLAKQDAIIRACKKEKFSLADYKSSTE